MILATLNFILSALILAAFIQIGYGFIKARRAK